MGFSILRGPAHTEDPVHHFFRQASAPDDAEIGDLWSDTTNNILKVVTDDDPLTFVEVGVSVAAHDLGGASHNADTLANLNSKVSDATLVDRDAANTWPESQTLQDKLIISGADLTETRIDLINASGGTGEKWRSLLLSNDGRWILQSRDDSGNFVDNLMTLSEADTSGDTALIINRNLSGAKSDQQVTMGAIDSGGSGFRVLRVPN